MGLTNQCPNCNEFFEEADVFESLRRLSIYDYRSDREVQQIARDFYGWTPENGKTFSDAIKIETSDGVEVIKCRNCGTIIVPQTGQVYGSLKEMKDETSGKETS